MRERDRNRETKRNSNRKGERQETVANAVVATVAVRSSVCNGAVVCHRWQQWLQERGQRDRERQETAAAAVVVSVSVVSVAVGDGVGEELSLHLSRHLPPTATAATSCDSRLQESRQTGESLAPVAVAVAV